MTTRQVSADYARTRDVFAGMIAEFHTVAEHARREASTRSDALVSLQDGVDRQRSYRLPAKPLLSETALQSSL